MCHSWCQEELKEIIDNTDDAESVLARYCDSSIIQDENSFSNLFEKVSSLEESFLGMVISHMLKHYPDYFLSYCLSVDNQALHNLVIDLITGNAKFLLKRVDLYTIIYCS